MLAVERPSRRILLTVRLASTQQMVLVQTKEQARSSFVTHYSQISRSSSMCRLRITTGDWCSGWRRAACRCASRPGIPSTSGTGLHGQEFELLVRRLGSGPAWVQLDVHADDVEAE